MTIAQLTGRKSLLYLISNIAVKGKSLYHLGMKQTTKATLARVNEQQSRDVYRDLFLKLFKQCEAKAPRHQFKFNGQIYLLDVTTVKLCLSVFPWATFLALMPTSGTFRVRVVEHHIVMIPIAPVPIGGGLMLVPVDSIQPAEMAINDFMQLYVSIGATSDMLLTRSENIL